VAYSKALDKSNGTEAVKRTLPFPRLGVGFGF